MPPRRTYGTTPRLTTTTTAAPMRAVGLTLPATQVSKSIREGGCRYSGRSATRVLTRTDTGGGVETLSCHGSERTAFTVAPIDAPAPCRSRGSLSSTTVG
jgi:hypothetical protein